MQQDLARIGPNGKRRRLQGACDGCKKKKIRCDSAEMPGNRCSNCITLQMECKHNRSISKEIWVAPQRRVKTAQEHVADILSTSTVYIPSNDPYTSHQVLVEVARYARALEEKVATFQSQAHSPWSITPFLTAESPSSTVYDDPDISDSAVEEYPIKEPLAGLMPCTEKQRYFGKSSSFHFTRAAMNQIHGGTENVLGVQRPEFWTARPWELLTVEHPRYFFPDHDLLKRLVKIYFEQINPLIGILHFPSFHQSLTDGQHYSDPQFGAVVLAVCSMASRYSDDPRVFLDGANSQHSCGWKWFRQVRPIRTSFAPEPSLQQLQLICLSVLYLAGSSSPEECWVLAGLGVRYGQAAGVHRRAGYSRMEALEAELYKRVFWILVAIDTIVSTFKGRPRITNSADIDLDLPADADEEHWATPNPVQPGGTPSTSSFIIAYLKLMMIFGRIQGAVYAVNGQQCGQDVIAELDSDLNKWVDAVPDHLRWNPQQQNQVFLDQSAALFTTYYHAQILIHRPFIPAPGKSPASNMSFPSLAICANAARSCGHVLDVQSRRGRGILHHPHIMTALFDCTVVLLINVWAVVGGGKSKTPQDFNHASADVQNCVRVLRLYERRWRAAGRKSDIISALLNIGKYASGSSSLKRSRDEDQIADPRLVPTHFSGLSPDERPVAGSSRVMSVDHQIRALELSLQETDHLFSLPLHTEELGRLPVYHSFEYDFRVGVQEDNTQYPPQSHMHEQGDVSHRNAFSDAPSIYAFPDASNTFRTTQNEVQSSLNVPSGDGWRDWSAYLASVEGLNGNSY
ncbi:fungal-specific transcription factor domain-containing protein [Mycena crocata]|nr:fungal-specific transcription factor domain-containing protein [Mycena crocata]